MLDSHSAVPLTDIVDGGETVVVRGTAPSKSILVLSDLDFPGWKATLKTEDRSRQVTIAPAFGGWRSVLIPGPGRFELTFSFQPASYRVGTMISLTAVIVWLTLMITTAWHQRRTAIRPSGEP
jgi:hypothetical protein